MAKFIFHGRVLPVFKEFTMVGRTDIHIEDDIGDPVRLAMDASIGITKGIIEVICESNLHGSDNYDGHVDLKANYPAKSVVNSYAFAKGIQLEAILETVVKPDGIKYNIQAHRPELEPLVTALHYHSGDRVDITPLLHLSVPNPIIFAVFKDLVGALDSGETLVNCARAIDGIREYMFPGDNKDQGWKVMRDNLNLSREFVKYISEGSKGPRHGNVLNMQFSIINEARKRSWIIANRFLEFKKRGDRQLPLTDFPLLP